jgi:hypothetical protein
MNRPVHGKRKEGFWIAKQRHFMTMEHQRRGAYISNQVRMHACHLTSKQLHIYFLFVTGKSSKKSSKIEKKKSLS